jgi:tetratricopeptide (TPR) repeat protein
MNSAGRRTRHLTAARQAVTPSDQADTVLLLDIIGSLPPSPHTDLTSAVDLERDAAMRLADNRDRWRATLRSHAQNDLLWAYTALSFECVPWIGSTASVAELLSELTTLRAMPILRFRFAICGAGGTDALTALQTAYPRYVEVSYFLADRALRAHELDTAEDQFRAAWAWHPRWPAVTKALADLALASEDFERAAEFFDHTMALVSNGASALGKLQALTYLGKTSEAVTLASEIMRDREGRVAAEAQRWRAWNELELGEAEQAFEDASAASQELSDGVSARLAGLAAWRLDRLSVAARELTTAEQRDPRDCDASFYRGKVTRESRADAMALEHFTRAAACFERQQQSLREDIGRIREIRTNSDRQQRLVLNREHSIARTRHLRNEAWLNAAECALASGRLDDARRFVGSIDEDDEFAAAGRGLLRRIK